MSCDSLCTSCDLYMQENVSIELSTFQIAFFNHLLKTYIFFPLDWPVSTRCIFLFCNSNLCIFTVNGNTPTVNRNLFVNHVGFSSQKNLINLRFKSHNINVKRIHTIYSFFLYLEQDPGVWERVAGALVGDRCWRRSLHSNRRHRKYKSAQRVYHYSAKINHEPVDGWASSFFPPQSLSLCHTQFQYFLWAGLNI